MTQRLTLDRLPPAARAVARAITDAVTAPDADALEAALTRLTAIDPEHVRVVLGGVVRTLLEELHPDGIGGDDLQDVVRRCAATRDVDPDVLVAVLTGALGVHPDTPLPGTAAAEDDPFGDGAEPVPLPGPEEVTRHAVLLVGELLAARGRPLRPYLEAAFTEIAIAEAEGP